MKASNPETIIASLNEIDAILDESKQQDDLRSLDLRIAVHLGWKSIGHNYGFGSIYKGLEPGEWYGYKPSGGLERVPHYTTDIAAAWELLEKLWAKDSAYTIELDFDKQYEVRLRDPDWDSRQIAKAFTAQLAICRAFEAAYLNATDRDLQRPAPEPAATAGD